MKRLVIDDIRSLPIESVTVRTAAEGIEKINSEPWDEIWLDFDLGGRPYETDDELTIMPLVKVLEEKEWAVMPTIYIHTQNPVGRQRIKAALTRYQIVDVAITVT